MHPLARRVVRDHGDWTTKEEISRKKRKEKKKNAPEGKLQCRTTKNNKFYKRCILV